MKSNLSRCLAIAIIAELCSTSISAQKLIHASQSLIGYIKNGAVRSSSLLSEGYISQYRPHQHIEVA